MRSVKVAERTVWPNREVLSRVSRGIQSGTTLSSSISSSVNNDEVRKFSAVGKDWWSAESNRGTGPLHAMNPVRVDFIMRTLSKQLSSTLKTPHLQLEGLDILDVGCGGGILSEALARLGANVTSIDPSDVNIGVASRHSSTDPLTSKIDYIQTTVDMMAKTGKKFDVVCSLEVIEHVETPLAFVADCALCVKDGGSLYLSTLNRNMKSFTFAIVGAEYVLGMLPPGTHDWHKFITPEELTIMVQAGTNNCSVLQKEGIVMGINPMTSKFTWHADPKDLEINYMLHAVKAKSA